VNRKVDPPVPQRVLELGREQPFAAELGQRPVELTIARGDK
jgi:hypothetical protein